MQREGSPQWLDCTGSRHVRLPDCYVRVSPTPGMTPALPSTTANASVREERLRKIQACHHRSRNVPPARLSLLCLLSSRDTENTGRQICFQVWRLQLTSTSGRCWPTWAVTQGGEGVPEEKGRDGPACRCKAFPCGASGLAPGPLPMFYDLEVFKVSWIFLMKIYHEHTSLRPILHLPPSCSVQRKLTSAQHLAPGGLAALTKEQWVWGGRRSDGGHVSTQTERPVWQPCPRASALSSF